MATIGDVRRYLKEDKTHLLVPAISNPYSQSQYKNAFANLIKQVVRDCGLIPSQLTALDDECRLTPEADDLFARFKRAVERLVDSI